MPTWMLKGHLQLPVICMQCNLFKLTEDQVTSQVHVLYVSSFITPAAIDIGTYSSNIALPDIDKSQYDESPRQALR